MIGFWGYSLKERKKNVWKIRSKGKQIERVRERQCLQIDFDLLSENLGEMIGWISKHNSWLIIKIIKSWKKCVYILPSDSKK